MAKSLNLEMVNCVLLVLVLTVLVVCCIKKSKETLTNYHYLSNDSCKNCSMCKKGKGCNCSNCQ
jgi:hypothetical protein